MLYGRYIMNKNTFYSRLYPNRTGGKFSMPTVYHQRRMLSTENRPVSALIPRFTNVALLFRTYTP